MTETNNLEKFYTDVSDDELLQRLQRLSDYTPAVQEIMLAESRKRPGLSRRIEAIREAGVIARRKSDEKFREDILLHLKELIPTRKFRTFGIAYWDTSGTTLAHSAQKLAAGVMVLGTGLGIQSRRVHHIGIIAITKDELFVLDMGQVQGEQINVEPFVRQIANASVSSSLFDRLSASCGRANEGSVLFIDGAIRLAATFPDLMELINPICAEQIRQAIQSTAKFHPQRTTLVVECPSCQSELAPNAMECRGRSLICPECGANVDFSSPITPEVVARLSPYYVGEFNKIADSGEAYTGQWNFAAFFFGGFWALLRGLWLNVLASIIILTLVGEINEPLTAMLGIAYSVNMGRRGTYLYYNRLVNKKQLIA